MTRSNRPASAPPEGSIKWGSPSSREAGFLGELRAEAMGSSARLTQSRKLSLRIGSAGRSLASFSRIRGWSRSSSRFHVASLTSTTSQWER